MPKKSVCTKPTKSGLPGTQTETRATSLASLTKSSVAGEECLSNPLPLPPKQTFSTPQKVSQGERFPMARAEKGLEECSLPQELVPQSPLCRLSSQIDLFMAAVHAGKQDPAMTPREIPRLELQEARAGQRRPDRFYSGHTQASYQQGGDGKEEKTSANCLKSKDTIKEDSTKQRKDQEEPLGKRLVKGISFKQDITAKSQPNSLIFSNSLKGPQTYQPPRGGFKLSARTMAIMEEAKEKSKRLKVDAGSEVDAAENLELISEEGSEDSRSSSGSEGGEEIPSRYRELGEKVEALDKSIRQLFEVKKKYPLFSEATRLVYQVMRL